MTRFFAVATACRVAKLFGRMVLPNLALLFMPIPHTNVSALWLFPSFHQLAMGFACATIRYQQALTRRCGQQILVPCAMEQPAHSPFLQAITWLTGVGRNRLIRYHRWASGWEGGGAYARQQLQAPPVSHVLSRM